MLFEKFCEGRDWNIESIGTIVLFDVVDLLGSLKSTGLLEDGIFGLRVDINRIFECAKTLALLVVKESTFLEEERYAGLMGWEGL